jgi:hypothetical protein
LKQKTAELNEEKEKFLQLKEDFKYNLKLLEQRDKELESYEETYSSRLYEAFLKARIKFQTNIYLYFRRP